MATTTTNPYLRGNFAPVPEHSTTELDVTGTLPPGLSGWLLRDGPNPVGDLLTSPNYHWFLGDGMVHGIELGDGKAISYRNRWIRTPHVEEYERLPAAPASPNSHPIGSGGVNVMAHAGRILGLGEAGLPYELDGDLDTVGQWDGDGALVGNFTAHPKVDPVTGEMLAFGYDFGPVNLRYWRINADGEVVQSEEITTPASTMMHDWGVTATRVVFMDLPVVFDFERLAAGKFPFEWSDDAGARLGVLPRTGGDADVVWVDVNPCYVFHPLNAYDDGDRVVMDVVRYPRLFDTDHKGPDHDATLWRWIIDAGAGTVKEEQLDDTVVEFPRVDERLTGRRHRYGYGVQVTTHDGLEGQGLVKWDLEVGTAETHAVGEGRKPSEGVFVPASAHAGEDEGWVLSVVYDRGTDRSDVIVVDASDFTASPVATVHLPVRVPFGFHGSWVPA
jgi:carotenoid cleavage oxygenase